MREPLLISPLSERSFSRFFSEFPHPKTQKKVYGFLPYWNMRHAALQPELTHLAYFALTIGEDGAVVTQSGGGTEPGYHQLQSETFWEMQRTLQARGGQTDIVVSQFSNPTIEAFLGSTAAQAQFLQSLDSLLLAYPFDGVNLDIEYAGRASPELRGQYTQFVQAVSTQLRAKHPGVELSVDVYANAALRPMLWEIEKLAPLVDYIIIMAYDFHRSSSPIAGPVAPLFAKEAGWSESISRSLQAFVERAPADKLLLGIPFYGYEWQTTAAEPAAFTFPNSGAVASYRRVQELLTQKETLGIQEHWDEHALAPYLTYSQGDKHVMVYYENAQSIAHKLEYVNQLDLAGIAIWSLGYEGDSRDLWESIDRQLEIRR